MSLTSVPSHRSDIFILDSWPFLERVLKGASIPRMDILIEMAARSEVRLLLSEMNLGEIFYLVAKQRSESEAESVMRMMTQLPIDIVGVASGDVLSAARLKALTTVSYADCFCAILAIRHGASVVTGDPDFLDLHKEGLLQVEWVGA
jgi:predicted nucleic acid-binding protein